MCVECEKWARDSVALSSNALSVLFSSGGDNADARAKMVSVARGFVGKAMLIAAEMGGTDDSATKSFLVCTAFAYLLEDFERHPDRIIATIARWKKEPPFLALGISVVE